MQEVRGSIPRSSTMIALAVRLSPSSRGLGHRPFTAVTGVRIPLGTPSGAPASPKFHSRLGASAVGAHQIRAPMARLKHSFTEFLLADAPNDSRHEGRFSSLPPPRF